MIIIVWSIQFFYILNFKFIWCKAHFQQSLLQTTIKTSCYIVPLMCSCGSALSVQMEMILLLNKVQKQYCDVFFQQLKSWMHLQFQSHCKLTVTVSKSNFGFENSQTQTYFWTSPAQLLTRYRTAWVREGRLRLLAESANCDRGLPVPAWATAPPPPWSLPPWSWRNAIPADTALSLQTRKHIQHYSQFIQRP